MQNHSQYKKARSESALSGGNTAGGSDGTKLIRYISRLCTRTANLWLKCFPILFPIIIVLPARAADFKDFPKWQAVLDRTDTNIGVLHAVLVTEYRFIPDKEDYWKTPAEFYKDGGGDCEDFAISLYFQAIASGAKEADMQIVVGWLRDRQEIHAALKHDGFYYDLRRAEPFPAIEYERVFKPLYGINRWEWVDLQ